MITSEHFFKAKACALELYEKAGIVLTDNEKACLQPQISYIYNLKIIGYGKFPGKPSIFHFAQNKKVLNLKYQATGLLRSEAMKTREYFCV